jgi:hypothetical protein
LEGQGGVLVSSREEGGRVAECKQCGTELTGLGWCNWCNADEQNPQHHAHVIDWQIDHMYHCYNAQAEKMVAFSFVTRLDDAGKQKVEDMVGDIFPEEGVGYE